MRESSFFLLPPSDSQDTTAKGSIRPSRSKFLVSSADLTLRTTYCACAGIMLGSSPASRTVSIVYQLYFLVLTVRNNQPVERPDAVNKYEKKKRSNAAPIDAPMRSCKPSPPLKNSIWPRQIFQLVEPIAALPWPRDSRTDKQEATRVARDQPKQ